MAFSKSTNKLNTTEEIFNQVQDNPLFDQNSWAEAANTGSLPAYINTLSQVNKIDNEEFKNTYSWDLLDAKQKILAANNELNTDEGYRTDLITKQRYAKNDDGSYKLVNGQPYIEDYETTEYEYWKSVLAEQAEYTRQQKLADKKVQAKNEYNWFLKAYNTALGVAGRLYQGVQNTTENALKLVTGLITATSAHNLSGADWNETFAKTQAASMSDLGLEVFDKIRDKITDWESKYSWLRDANGNDTTYGKYVGGALTTTGEYLPAMIPGMQLSGLGVNPTIASLASEFTFYGSATARNIGEMYKQNYEGITVGQMMANETFKSIAQYGVEKVLGALLGGTQLDHLIYGREAKSLSANSLTKSGIKSIFKDAAQEGLEEVLQDMSDYFVNDIFSNIVNTNFNKIQDLTFQGLFDSFAIAAISSIGSSAVNIGIDANKVDIDAYKLKLKDGELGYSKEALKANTIARWQFGVKMNEVASFIQEYQDGKMKESQFVDGIVKVYESTRLLSSLFEQLGDDRVNKAREILDVIGEKIEKGVYTDTKEDIKKNIVSSLQETIKTLEYGTKENAKRLARAFANKDKSAIAKAIADFKGRAVTSIVTNETVNEDIPAEANIFADNPDLKAVVKTSEGQNAEIVDNEDGTKTLVVPEVEMENVPVEGVVKDASEHYLINNIQKVSEFRNVKNDIVKLYREHFDAKANEKTAIAAFLYRPEFFNIAIARLGRDVLQIALSIKTMVNTMKMKGKLDAAYAGTINNVLREMKANLASYLILNIDKVDLHNLATELFTKEEIRAIMTKNRALKAMNNTLTIFDKQHQFTYAESVIRNSSLSLSQKNAYIGDLKSGDTVAINAALHIVQGILEEHYKGKYNGEIYFEETNIMNRLANGWLKSYGLTLQMIKNRNFDDNFLRSAYDYSGDLSVQGINDYLSHLFNIYTGGNYNLEISKDGSLSYSRVGNRDLSPFVENAIHVSMEAQSDIGPKGTMLDPAYRTINLSKYTREDIDQDIKDNITIDDLITNPTLLKNSIRQQVLNEFGDFSYAGTLSVLQEDILQDTNGKMYIVPTKAGGYTLADVHTWKSAMKRDITIKDVKNTLDKAVLEKQTDGTYKIVSLPTIRDLNFINDEYLYGILGNVTLAHSNDGRTRYNMATNTIYLNLDNYNDTNIGYIVMHEFTHAIQSQNLLLGGSNIQISGMLSESQQKALLEDFAKTFPELNARVNSKGISFDAIEGDKVVKINLDANKFVERLLYNITGEMVANGQMIFYMPYVVRLTNTGVEIVSPSGKIFKGHADPNAMKNISMAFVLEDLEGKIQQLIPKDNNNLYYSSRKVMQNLQHRTHSHSNYSMTTETPNSLLDAGVRREIDFAYDRMSLNFALNKYRHGAGVGAGSVSYTQKDSGRSNEHREKMIEEFNANNGEMKNLSLEVLYDELVFRWNELGGRTFTFDDFLDMKLPVIRLHNNDFIDKTPFLSFFLDVDSPVVANYIYMNDIEKLRRPVYNAIYGYITPRECVGYLATAQEDEILVPYDIAIKMPREKVLLSNKSGYVADRLASTQLNIPIYTRLKGIKEFYNNKYLYLNGENFKPEKVKISGELLSDLWKTANDFNNFNNKYSEILQDILYNINDVTDKNAIDDFNKLREKSIYTFYKYATATGYNKSYENFKNEKILVGINNIDTLTFQSDNFLSGRLTLDENYNGDLQIEIPINNLGVIIYYDAWDSPENYVDEDSSAKDSVYKKMLNNVGIFKCIIMKNFLNQESIDKINNIAKEYELEFESEPEYESAPIDTKKVIKKGRTSNQNIVWQKVNGQYKKVYNEMWKNKKTREQAKRDNLWYYKVPVTDENGNILYNKSGSPRVEYHYYDEGRIKKQTTVKQSKGELKGTTNLEKFGYAGKYKELKLRPETQEFINKANDKIDADLWKEITDGKFNDKSVNKYLYKADSIDDKTFKLINDIFFKNPNISNFKELTNLTEKMPAFYAVNFVLNTYPFINETQREKFIEAAEKLYNKSGIDEVFNRIENNSSNFKISDENYNFSSMKEMLEFGLKSFYQLAESKTGKRVWLQTDALSIDPNNARKFFMERYRGNIGTAASIAFDQKLAAMKGWKTQDESGSGNVSINQEREGKDQKKMTLEDTIADTSTDERTKGTAAKGSQSKEELLDFYNQNLEELTKDITGFAEGYEDTKRQEIIKVLTAKFQKEIAGGKIEYGGEEYQKMLKELTIVNLLEGRKLDEKYLEVVKGKSKEDIEKLFNKAQEVITAKSKALAAAEISRREKGKLTGKLEEAEKSYIEEVGLDGNINIVPKMQLHKRINSVAAGIKSSLRIVDRARFLKEHSDMFTSKIKLKDDFKEAMNADELNDLHKKLLAIKEDVDRGKYFSSRVKSYFNEIKEDVSKGKERIDKLSFEQEKLKAENARLEEENKAVKFQNRKLLREIELDKNNKVALVVKGDREMPKLLKDFLLSEVESFSTRKVQYLSKENAEQAKFEVTQFVNDNYDKLTNMTQLEVNDIADYLLNTDIVIGLDNTANIIGAELVIGTFLLKNEMLGVARLDEATKEKLNNKLENMVTTFAKGLSAWSKVYKELDTDSIVVNAFAKMNGVEFQQEDTEKLTKAIKAKNINDIMEAKKTLYNNAKIIEGKMGKMDRLLQFERLMMLSSPGTWVRNIISNSLIGGIKIGKVVIPGLSQASEGVGTAVSKVINKLLPKSAKDSRAKVLDTQYKITGIKTTNEVASFIDTIIDGEGWWKLLKDGFNKFEFSTNERAELEKEGVDEVVDRTQMKNYTPAFNRLIMSTIKTEIFNADKWHSKPMKAIDEFIMKMLSDDKWIERQARMYLGKILSESKDIDLSKGMTTKILYKMADAYTLAAYEYMHKRNVINDIDDAIYNKNKAFYFVYKQILPFGTSTLNWFMESLNYTPIGLVKGLVNYIKLEDTVNRMETAREKFKSNISAKFADYLARKQIGKGVIGSVGIGIGMLLAAMGMAGIDKDDDKVVLRVADLKVDISGLFGTSSLIAGITFMQMIRNDKSFLEASEKAALALFNDDVYSSLYNTFRYNESFLDILQNLPYDMIRMMVPNALQYLNRILNTRDIKYSSGITGKLQRLFMNTFISAPLWFPDVADIVYIDPYTGKKQLPWNIRLLTNAVSKSLPISIEPYTVTGLEKEADSLGISKGMLTGEYTINEEDVTLSQSEKRDVNEFYGRLNNIDLTDLTGNKTLYQVYDESKKKYVKLRYKDMSDEQKKAVINRIMTNNSSIAKTYILTQKGYKYYTNQNELQKLKSLGITNIYLKNKKYSGYTK